MKLKNNSLLQFSIRKSLVFLFIVTIVNLIWFIHEKKTLYLYSFLTTCIASIFYFYFYYKRKIQIGVRYMDWIITTPILLLELCILSEIQDVKIITIILCINFLTFGIGWIGELKCFPRFYCCFLAFIPFFFTFFLIGKYGEWNNYITFFIIIWTLYGLVYLLKSSIYKNILYNFLDCLSKGLFSLLII